MSAVVILTIPSQIFKNQRLITTINTLKPSPLYLSYYVSMFWFQPNVVQAGESLSAPTTEHPQT